MNSEELELSLRNEFENYLKNALADMKQEVSDFQEKFEAELDQHKANLDEAFKGFSEKISDDKELEDSFKESVTEHLKLARDEGARITATAIAEAEKIEEEEKVESADAGNFSNLRDAIDEICSKDSQSEILKSLVHYAAEYTPRGAFFIVKNEHLVGWRVFGREEHSNPQSVREVFFPVASNTALGESIKSLGTVTSSYGSYEDDSIYLNQLEFGQPEKMYSIPLVARGRGVAVLYADSGEDGDSLNAEALETLVRVAGLTVEVLASAKGAKQQAEQKDSQTTEEPAQVEEVESQETVQEFTPEPAESYSFTDTQDSTETVDDSYTVSAPVEEETASYQQDEFQTEPVAEVQEDYFTTTDDSIEEVKSEEPSTDYDFQPVEQEETVVEEVSSDDDSTSNFGDFSWNQSNETVEEPQEITSETQEISVDEAPSVEDYQAEINQTYEVETPAQFDESPTNEDSSFDFQQDSPAEFVAESPVEETPTSFDTSFETPSDTFEQSPVEEEVEEVVEEETVEAETVAPPPVKPRFGDRNVDLPIEVTEDERRLHNDARRFARLLVSEIKLYNEQKVKEGRDSSDLYERLREAIDRSREMYDKRVQPPVAAKFDYFHYELVNTLAEGEEPKLGNSYPGATI